MQIDTPEGQLTIDETELKFKPVDDGPELVQSLNPVPKYEYHRGIYGTGTLVVGDHLISLDADQAPAVIEELRRPRESGKKAAKPEIKRDGDSATIK